MAYPLIHNVNNNITLTMLLYRKEKIRLSNNVIYLNDFTEHNINDNSVNIGYLNVCIPSTMCEKEVY